MSALLTPVAVGLIQWWLWCSGLVLLLALAVKVAGPRRPAVHDLLCRAFVSLELVLLPASLALTLKDMPPAPPAIPIGPSGEMLSRPVAMPSPVRDLPGAAVPTPPAPGPAAAVSVATTLPEPARGPIALGLSSWAAAAILAVYVAGVSIGSARLARRLRRSLELLSLPGDAPPGSLVDALRMLERRMGIRHPVRLILTDRASVPLLAGWRRPAILLPAALAERLSPAALEPLLAHELAHHVRRDVPWKLAEAIAAVLAWPLPLQRWAGRTMARASEVLCDRMAAEDPPARETYARALFEVLAADRGSRSLAFGAPAMASKSFLRRRIEIVLAGEDLPARLPAARKLALLLAAAACAAPVLALQVRAAPGGPPPGPAKAPVAIRSAALLSGHEGDDTPEPIRRAQEELRNLLRDQAAAEYAAGRHDRATDHLRRAHDLGASGVEMIPLGGTMAALDLGRAASPFVIWVIEKKFGDLLKVEPGHLVDAKAGLLVQELGVLERIRGDLFPAPAEDKMISFQMRFLRLGAEEAARWARILGEDHAGLEWSHALTAEESARLEARIREAADAKDDACAVEQSPSLTVLDGQSASFLVVSQSAYIERYELLAKGGTRVADPVVGVVNDGIEAECFSRLLDDGRVRALFRVTQTRSKGFQEVHIDLSPWAHRVPIQVPIIEKDVAFHDAVIAEGDGTILGLAPSRSEEKLHGPLERSWIWVKCQVVGE
jgi:beta-lactamase regulating signal transducer with metallopeptidase domain